MTGPAPGKIPIDVSMEIHGKKVNVKAYIHVKGFSRAMVTHLDIEEINIRNNEEGYYVILIGTDHGFLVITKRSIEINGVRTNKLYIRGLKLLRRGERTSAWLGFKEKGFYLGFKKDVLRRLEEIAKQLAPKYFQSEGDLENFIDSSE